MIDQQTLTTPLTGVATIVAVLSYGRTIKRDTCEQISNLRAEVTGEIKAVRTDLTEQISGLRSDVRDVIRDVRAGVRVLEQRTFDFARHGAGNPDPA